MNSRPNSRPKSGVTATDEVKSPYLQICKAETIINEELQNVIWGGLYKCTHDCLGGTKPCIGGNSYTFYGKEFTSTCPHSLYLAFIDPDAATLKNVRRLLEIEKQARMGK